MGGKCSQCGWSGHHAGLEFDHIDPAQKAYEISRLLANKDTTRLYAEAAKCQLLCGTCHNIKTYMASEFNGNYVLSSAVD